MDETISPAALHARIRAGESLTVLDVRDRKAYDAWRIEGGDVESTYAPYLRFVAAEARGEVAEFVGDLDFDLGEPVVVVCARGETSAHAAELLREVGVDAANLAGGMEAWADLYVAHDLPFEGGVLRQYERPATGCLAYLLASDGEALVVDPLRTFMHRYERDSAELGCELGYAFDTHVHADHLSGGRALADDLGVPYHLPAAAAERDVAYSFEPLARNETLDVGGVGVKALATPGHTDDGASYLVGRSAVLTGDTLFTDSVGRTELQFAADGDSDAGDGATDGEDEPAGAATGAERLYGSLHGTLLAEPDGVVVCPGHFAVANDGTTGDVVPGEPVTTTVGSVRRGLDVLGLDREAFVETITATLPEKPPNYEAVIAANRGVESPPDETAAIELELGPNRCAADAGGESTADD